MAKKRITLEDGLAALKGEAPQEDSQPTETETKKPKKKRDSEIQISAYISRDLYRKVRIALAEEEQTFTGLIRDYLEKWVRER
jgi:hypothetical protein